MIRVDLDADEFGRFLEMHSRADLGGCLDRIYYYWTMSQDHSKQVAAAVIMDDGSVKRWVHKDLVEDAIYIKVASRRKR